MELKEEDDNKETPSTQVSKSITIKKKKKFIVSMHLKYLKNPSISKFNLNSRFIYDLDEPEEYLKSVTDKNLIKPKKKYIDNMKERINLINLEKDAEKKSFFIKLPVNVYEGLKKFSQIKRNNSPLVDFLQNKFQNEKSRHNLACIKLAEEYYNTPGRKTNRQTICNLIRNQLGYCYRKTTVKNGKIKGNENILISYSFIKIISKCIFLGFKIIYVDESTISNKNNNYFCWRKKDEEILFNFNDCKRASIIMAVDENDVIFYQINKENTSSEKFLEFMKELNKKLYNIKYGKYVLVLDSLSSHKTNDLIEYYSNNRINVIFNSPYISVFNSIELAFRSIKRKIYVSLFDSLESIESRIINIITSEEFKKTLKYNFAETLNEYIKYYEKIKNINFNI